LVRGLPCRNTGFIRVLVPGEQVTSIFPSNWSVTVEVAKDADPSESRTAIRRVLELILGRRRNRERAVLSSLIPLIISLLTSSGMSGAASSSVVIYAVPPPGLFVISDIQ